MQVLECLSQRVRQAIIQMIRERRRSAPFRFAAAACEKYLRAWYNENFWEFDRNGEAFVMAQIARRFGGEPINIWDVGANHGQWADKAHDYMPRATIHCFEIVPAVSAAIPPAPWRHVHNAGLSSSEGVIDVHWSTIDDTGSSIAPRSELETLSKDVEVVSAPVLRGDSLVQTLGAPQFLKIDVEGHEAAVLQGCAELLRSASAPLVVQFEYGSTFIPSGGTLREIYALLDGYEIGRVYPNHVDFQPYSYAHDHFRMGNMIAVRDAELRRLLA